VLPINTRMSIWVWLAVGMAAFIVLPILFGLTVGRILRQVAQDVNDLLEAEEWSGAPLTRALEAPPEMPSSNWAASRESLRRAD
jgi:hypothetical protein